MNIDVAFFQIFCRKLPFLNLLTRINLRKNWLGFKIRKKKITIRIRILKKKFYLKIKAYLVKKINNNN